MYTTDTFRAIDHTPHLAQLAGALANPLVREVHSAETPSRSHAPENCVQVRLGLRGRAGSRLQRQFYFLEAPLLEPCIPKDRAFFPLAIANTVKERNAVAYEERS